MILLGTEWTWCFRKWWFPELLCVHWQFHTHPPFRSTDLWGAKEPWQGTWSPQWAVFLSLFPLLSEGNYGWPATLEEALNLQDKSGFQPNLPHNPSGLSSVRSMVFKVRKIAILITFLAFLCVILEKPSTCFQPPFLTLCLT